MSRLPTSVIWTAKDHTLAKIEIVKRYAYKWALIVGTSSRFAGKPITFIDGFAGPGEYENHTEGSPLAALKAMNDARERAGERWRAGPMYALFIEQKKAREAHLKGLIKDRDVAKKVKYGTKRTTFEQGIAYAEERIEAAFRSDAPLLVFIDPFGAKGVPWHVVERILSSETSEIILNFDADGIARIFRSGSASKSDEILTTIYGNEDWREAIPKLASTEEIERRLLDLYRKQLRALPNVDYNFPFEMRTRSGRLNYYLLFASQHHRGLEKMKETMKEIDHSGSYCFRSASQASQYPLFTQFDQAEDWVPALLREFGGCEVSHADVLKFTLNDTLLINPSKLLYAAQERGLLEAEFLTKRARRNDFAPAKIKLLRFREAVHA